MIKLFKNYKFKICFFLIMLIFFSVLQVQAYSSLKNYKPIYGTVSSNVNFRNIASTSGYVVKVLKKGTAVKMVGTLDSYYVIQLASNEVGVVAKSYIKSSTIAPKGALTYTTITQVNVTTNTTNVNLRRGAGTSFGSIKKLAKGSSLKAIGYISNWYIVITKDGIVGSIRKDFLSFNTTSNIVKLTDSSPTLSANEQTILNLLNEARTKAGIAKLKTDSTLFKIARLKATDMVKNSYFSHTSPTYGSPFKMMTTYGIAYKTAGENIAGNPNLKNAVEAWLNSATHKQNILSSSYNYVGIGITASKTYGYIIDVMFIR